MLDRLTTQPDRDWYATAAAEHGWSRHVLLHHIRSQLHRRVGAAPSNFTDQLPAPDSDLAQQLVRDPYVFDFQGYLTSTRTCRRIPTAKGNLVSRVVA